MSFLELFYDLVYVAVIAQAAHHLAEHVSVRGTVEIAIVFCLTWIAWVNGSLYIEIHGRDDGRTRLIVFAQMGVLALLAVFTAHAADGTGPAFAIVYAAFLGVVTWLFSVVRRTSESGHGVTHVLSDPPASKSVPHPTTLERNPRRRDPKSRTTFQAPLAGGAGLPKSHPVRRRSRDVHLITLTA